MQYNSILVTLLFVINSHGAFHNGPPVNSDQGFAQMIITRNTGVYSRCPNDNPRYRNWNSHNNPRLTRTSDDQFGTSSETRDKDDTSCCHIL